VGTGNWELETGNWELGTGTDEPIDELDIDVISL
jgi:hypothetical protein